MHRTWVGLFALSLFVAGCGSSESDGPGGGGTSGGGGSGATGTGATGTGAVAGSSGASGSAGSGGSGATAGSGGSGGSAGSGGSGAAAGSGGSGAPSAAELLATLGSCAELTKGKYKKDDEPSAPADVPICGLVGAVYWQADMDIDCDGIAGNECNATTDPWFQAQTSATDSKGKYLNAATLPYVVVPLPSSRFDYSAAGLALGSVVAVIYAGQVRYGVFGDEGPQAIIGEASYAMAASLGIDPNPATGGVDSGVTYIAFTGAGSVMAPIEDHAGTVTLGESLAAALIAKN